MQECGGASRRTGANLPANITPPWRTCAGGLSADKDARKEKQAWVPVDFLVDLYASFIM